MRFLLDESVERRLETVLISDGHDVAVIGVDFPSSLDDIEVLGIAHQETRILITNDTDFGELTYRLGVPHSGIILMRLPTFSTSSKGGRLIQVIQEHADALSGFTVVSPQGIRIR